MITDQST